MDYKTSINAVLIADKYQKTKKIELNSYDLEMVNERYFNDVYSGLLEFCQTVTIYTNPKAFLRNIAKHKNDVVISIWSGTQSKSRKGLIPAICEAYGICYVGSDCYVQILCQDKALTKEYCKKFGISSPNYKVVTRHNPDYNFFELKLPLVIKPLSEGGSIGISNKNLVHNYTQAEDVCKTLLKYYDSLIVEEYIDGYELCVILFGNEKEIKTKGAAMLDVEGTQYLKNFIWGYEYKKDSASPLKIKSVDASYLLSNEDWDKFEKLYFSLGKVELIRIDGRINENGFQLIELSPDPHIGSGASVAEVFKYNGIDYKAMIKKIVTNSLSIDKDQSAKKPTD